MKKISSVILAFAMIAVLAFPAFATGSATAVDTSGKSFDVNGEFVAAATPATVISVDIEWDAMNFTYTAASAGTWNTQTHKYDGKSDVGWSDNKAKITVTNHSNTKIGAYFKFNSTASGVEGIFTNRAVVLESADADAYRSPTGSTTAPTAPKGSTEFGIAPTSAAVTSTQTTLGTISISIKQPTVVNNSTELMAAYNTLRQSGGGVIVCGSDITGNCEGFLDGAPVVIDLGGHTFTGNFICIGTSTGSSIDVTIQNGSINYVMQNAANESGRAVIFVDRGSSATVTLKDLEVNTTNAMIVSMRGSEWCNFTFDDCIIDAKFTTGISALLKSGQLVLKNNTTISGALSASDDVTIKLTAGGTYSINGTSIPATTDVTLTKQTHSNVFEQ